MCINMAHLYLVFVTEPRVGHHSNEKKNIEKAPYDARSKGISAKKNEIQFV